MDVRSGEVIAEGKTKIIRNVRQRSDVVLIESKDDITAGDGAKHDVMKGKAEWSTTTTCNVFRLLERVGIRMAFVDRLDKTHFLARKCTMLPYEVVVRREAQGSYLKRHPDVAKGTRFPELKVEFFLKTTGKKWKDVSLPVDDPLIVPLYEGNKTHLILYYPDKPHSAIRFPFADYPGSDRHCVFEEMKIVAHEVFLILETAWAALGLHLADFKVEFGTDDVGRLLLADVIDNDSWRLLENGEYQDKQSYRDGVPLDEVARRYARVAELSSRLRLQ